MINAGSRKQLSPAESLSDKAEPLPLPAAPCISTSHSKVGAPQELGEQRGHSKSLTLLQFSQISMASPPPPTCTQPEVPHTATQLLSAVFVGKRGLKGKALGEKGERGALPLLYLCLCSCMQCNNGVQCPGEPITTRSTAKQGLGHSPFNFLNTVSSSQKSTAARKEGKEQSRLPTRTHHPRQGNHRQNRAPKCSSGAPLLVGGDEEANWGGGVTPNNCQHNTVVRFLFQTHERPINQTMRRKYSIELLGGSSPKII